MSFWDKVKGGAKAAGDATKVAAQKTKLRTDMMMIDRDIQNRKKTFGISMYDHVSPLSQSPDFYAASDDLTTMLRPPLIEAQKEIQALAAKRVKLKESLAAAEAKRAGAFPTKAETVGQKFMNFGKASAMHSGETKIKAELAVVDRQIRNHKQTFGLSIFVALAEAEDTKGYLPTDRQVRSLYDACRGDIQRMESNKKQKMEELKELGGSVEETAPSVVETSNGTDAGFGGDLSMENSYSDQAPATSNTSAPTGQQQMDDLLL